MATPTNPAPPFLGIAFFQHSSGQGWSEGYYINKPDYAAAAAGLNTIIQKRLVMMSEDFAATYFRVSDPSKRGDSFATLINPFSHGTMEGSPKFMDVGTATLVRLQAANGKHAMRLLHAVPVDIMWQDSDLYKETGLAAWDTGFNNWLIEVKAQSGFYSKVPGGFEFQTITDGIPLKIRNRKIGRPFGLSRGRGALATATP